MKSSRAFQVLLLPGFSTLAALCPVSPARGQGYLVRTFTGTSNSDFLGRSVAGAGDQDGDGVPDVVAGAQGNPPHAHLFSGATGALLTILSAPGGLGWAVANGGDMDADGVP